MNITQQKTEASSMQCEKTGWSSLFSTRVNLVLGMVSALLVVLFGMVFILKPENLYADDSYFYLQVAWNIARGMGSTFNNVMPTNGYHPLFMLVCTAVFKIFPERLVAIHAVAAVIVLLDVLMLVTVRRILLRTGGDLWPISLLLLVPFSFLTQLGTEGALSGFLLALMMLFAYKLVQAPDGSKAVLYNLVAALAVLTRLDSIFIIAFLWVSVTVALWRAGRRSLQFATIPIYMVLWGAYLASNRIYFHLWQPISGMLKSNSGGAHILGANLPHVALAAFALIVVSGAGLALTKRDLFFTLVEIPFAAGVVCHGLYITFRLSNETRWTWYYTSWVLLAAVMLARFCSVLLEKRRGLVAPLGALCVGLLAFLWVRISYMHDYKRPSAIATLRAFSDEVEKKDGIHRAVTYDQPGRLAFYSNIQIIPLDGLMGDTKFQTDLASMGIEKFVRVNHVDGFVGPETPLAPYDYGQMCNKLYLSSVSFQCAPVPGEPGRLEINAVSVYARVPAAYAGTLQLPKSQLIWATKDYVSVWKLTP
jgi:hypothetical protein